ncbi:MAG TPA: hypothetical protein VJ717_16415 [Gemmatimonadaceae bacterium]|nr:hypothetical protein [Gemmatimonadaceae bacterium]
MRVRLITGVFAATIAVTACGSGGSSAPGSPAAAQTTAPQRGNSRLITRQEIESVPLETIYDVIERLRPNMLRSRGSPIMVYLNTTLLGEVSTLRGIQASSVRQVEFVSASDATTRFGTGVPGGAIVITSR